MDPVCQRLLSLSFLLRLLFPFLLSSMAHAKWQAAHARMEGDQILPAPLLPFLLRRAVWPTKPELHLPFPLSAFTLTGRAQAPTAAAVILRSGAPIPVTEATRGLTVFHRSRRYP